MSAGCDCLGADGSQYWHAPWCAARSGKPTAAPCDPELLRENADLWEYVWAMEAANIAMDEGNIVDTARINAAQEKLKLRHATKGAGS